MKDLFYFFCVMVLWMPAGQAGQREEQPQKLIRIKSLKKNLKFLASDKMRGRLSGTPDLKRAARFLVKKFRTSGLQGAGPKGSYFQSFRLYQTAYIEKASLSIFRGKRKLSFSTNRDFYPTIISATGIARGPAFFLGPVKNLTAKTISILSLKGTIALITCSPKALKSLSAKIALIEKRGALGVLILIRPFRKTGITTLPTAWQHFVSQSLGFGASQIKNFMSLYLPGISKMGGMDPQVMLKMRQTGMQARFWSRTSPFSIPVVLGGKKISRLIFRELKKQSTGSTALLSRLTIHLAIKLHREKKQTQNVVAFRLGDDPKLKKEVVIIGAHYDHVGYIGGFLGRLRRDAIWNGADDNGSGTVALLEIAKVLGNKHFSSPRSILLIGFSAEEYGLVGSRYYVSHPIFPLAKTVAMINLDMVGRNNTKNIYVIGMEYSKNLSSILTKKNRFFRIKKMKALLKRSDQYPFYQRKIPILFFTSGLHRDYHERSDEVDKINFPKIQKVALLAWKIAREVAKQKGRPDFK